MSAFVGFTLNFIHKRFNFYHKDLIHIEGGLGSQILGVISFWNLREKLGADAAKCDLSYFSEEAQSRNLWPYELGRFGLDLSEFKPFERSSKINLLKSKKDFLSDEELNVDYWETSRKKYKDKFDYDLRTIEDYFEREANLNLTEPFAAIHIRRGDYLMVASRIVQINEYLDLIKSVRKTFPKRVIVISDTLIDSDSKSSLNSLLDKNELIYLDKPSLEAFYIHCLLREADVLVTANSTYSFSAALLGRPGQTVFSPLQFHSGDGSEKYDNSFRDAGSFFVWPMRG